MKKKFTARAVLALTTPRKNLALAAVSCFVLSLTSQTQAATLFGGFWAFQTTTTSTTFTETVSNHNLQTTPTLSRTSDGTLGSFTTGPAYTDRIDGTEWDGGNAAAWNGTPATAGIPNPAGSFTVSSLNFTGLEPTELRFDRRVTNNAVLSAAPYSLAFDIGNGFVDSGLTLTSFTVNGAYSAYTIDLSSLSAIDNQANVALRFSFPITNATNSNVRIDNLEIVAIPEPSTAALAGVALAALAGLRRRA